MGVQISVCAPFLFPKIIINKLKTFLAQIINTLLYYSGRNKIIPKAVLKMDLTACIRKEMLSVIPNASKAFYARARIETDQYKQEYWAACGRFKSKQVASMETQKEFQKFSRNRVHIKSSTMEYSYINKGSMGICESNTEKIAQSFYDGDLFSSSEAVIIADALHGDRFVAEANRNMDVLNKMLYREMFRDLSEGSPCDKLVVAWIILTSGFYSQLKEEDYEFWKVEFATLEAIADDHGSMTKSYLWQHSDHTQADVLESFKRVQTYCKMAIHGKRR